MIVHLHKLALAVATIAIAPFWYAIPTRAEEEEMTALERFNLCTAFPLNSRCEGYTPPVALKQRSGNEGMCKVQVGETETAGRCKILLTDELITVFVEEGDKLALLDNKKDTREFSIAIGDVSNLRYREMSKRDVEETIGLTLLVGLLPALLISGPEHFSEMSIGLTETTQSNLTALRLITKRDLGMHLRTNLERSTGLFVEVLLDEEDEPEEQIPTVVESQDPEPTDLDQFCQDFPLNSRCEAAGER